MYCFIALLPEGAGILAGVSDFAPGLHPNPTPTMNRSEEVARRIVQLDEEHRDLDAAISALESSPPFDEQCVRRMKKRKLQLKDHIALQRLQLPFDLTDEAGAEGDGEGQ